MSRLALLLLAGVSLSAQQLPHVTVETLAGNKVELPSGIAGKAAVLCIGFSHASQNQVKPWVAKLRDRFKQKSNVATYPLAVLEDAPRLVRGMIVHAMKGDVAPADLDKFFVVYKDERQWKQVVGFELSDDAYLLVLDPAGTICYQLHGPPTTASLEDLITHVATVLSSVRSSK